MIKQQLKILPEFFKPIFWSYNFDSIDMEKHKKRIIVNTVNYGNWQHWQWILKEYGKKEVQEIIKEIPVSEFRQRPLRLISLLLGIKNLKHEFRSVKSRG